LRIPVDAATGILDILLVANDTHVLTVAACYFSLANSKDFFCQAWLVASICQPCLTMHMRLGVLANAGAVITTDF
jgi:hypothetical protein